MAAQFSGTRLLVGPPAVGVQKLRDQLLSCAALADQHHRSVGPRHLAGDIHRVPECWRDTEERQFVAIPMALEHRVARQIFLAAG